MSRNKFINRFKNLLHLKLLKLFVMETQTLIQKINKLPLLEIKEVDDFVEFLLFKQKNLKSKSKKERTFGVFKNKIKMSDDFDAPISDFKSYME
jgi:hypothetical protein